MIAEATYKIIVDRVVQIRGSISISGLYHLAASGTTSWSGCARRIVAFSSELAIINNMILKEIRSISSDEYFTQARRPSNTVLSTTKIVNTYSLWLPTWHELLQLSLSEFKKS